MLVTIERLTLDAPKAYRSEVEEAERLALGRGFVTEIRDGGAQNLRAEDGG